MNERENNVVENSICGQSALESFVKLFSREFNFNPILKKFVQIFSFPLFRVLDHWKFTGY
jgi:hypothetical protein